MLPLTWPGKWKEQEGAPASLNVSFDICMASATYAPTLGLAESVRLTSGSKEPGLVAELRSLGCKSTTMPPAINWSQELANNLRQEIADPLVPVHPDLPGLATRHTPPDDQDAHEDQHRIMRCWHANASGLRAKVEGQLARETLLQWVPVMQDCLSLLSLPLSLQAGEIRLTQGNFGNQIVDFADRATRLRCCNQREAWHMLTMPAVAMAGALSQLCTPVLRLSEHQALDLSWYQLAKPQIWLWLLLDEIEALTPSIALSNAFKLGTYELRGRHAALFAANLRAIDNLSPRTASRLVHRLGESSTPQAWEQQHREFLANGGLAPGLEGDLYFISQELFANKLRACQEQLSNIWKERSFAKLYLLNDDDEHMEDPDGAYPMALDSWTPPDWRAGTSSSRAWWH